MSIEEFMKSVDPAYGSQDHQRRYVERMRELQATHPCGKNHDADTPPCHTAKCYPEKAMQEAIVADMRRSRDRAGY